MRAFTQTGKGATMGPQVRFGVIGIAWGLYRRRWGTWSLAMLIVMLAYPLASTALFALFGMRWPGGGSGFRLPLSPGARALHYVASTVIGGFFVGGMVRMASNQVLGRRPRIEDLFSVVDAGFQLLAGAVFYGAATFLGSLLCVIPGLVVSGLLMFTIPLIAIAHRPATDAVAESWKVLSSQWLPATIFHVVLCLLSGSGFLLCGVGILLTGPLYSLSIAVLFHEFFYAAPPPSAKKPPVDSFPEF
jgi:hypothetical protein